MNISKAHDEALDLCPECGSAAVLHGDSSTFPGSEFFSCPDCDSYGWDGIVEGHFMEIRG